MFPIQVGFCFHDVLIVQGCGSGCVGVEDVDGGDDDDDDEATTTTGVAVMSEFARVSTARMYVARRWSRIIVDVIGISLSQRLSAVSTAITPAMNCLSLIGSISFGDGVGSGGVATRGVAIGSGGRGETSAATATGGAV